MINKNEYVACDTKEEVLRVLRTDKNKFFSVAEIKKETKLPDNRIRRALRILLLLDIVMMEKQKLTEGCLLMNQVFRIKNGDDDDDE